MACAECPWEPDPSTGQLVFSDVDDFTIPNYAVQFVKMGTLALEIGTLAGADTEHGTGYTPQEWAPETSRKATLELEMSFACDPDGEPYLVDPEDPNSDLDLAAGWEANWALLDALLGPTETGDGTQTVLYTPFDGADAAELTVKVTAVRMVDGHQGQGLTVAVDVVVYNPEALALDVLVAPEAGVACAPPWEPDEEEGGELWFLDPTDNDGWFVVPNYMVRLVNEGAERLGQRSLVGDDVVTISATVPYPMVEKQRVAALALQMAFTHYADGTPAASPTEGAVRNLRTLNAIAARSTDEDAEGLQAVRWYPPGGDPDIEMQAHVSPVVFGTATPGQGCLAGVTVTVPNPSTIEELP